MLYLGAEDITCMYCGSDNLAKFRCAVFIHFAHQQSNNDDVRVFPTVTICRDCGFSEFMVSEKARGKIAATG